MSALTDARNAVAAALRTACDPLKVKVMAEPPATVTSTAATVVVSQGDPWVIGEGLTLGRLTAAWDIHVIVNPARRDALVTIEHLAEVCLEALDVDPWAVTEISAPFRALYGSAEFLVCTLTATQPI